ncbi:GntR family transcriptional regulator [Lachnoclostridium sp. An169]|uniref:GntR family transcriptional regulator n=1 Tax=Lachnoclostridium sp. An169 TaxID=1965569 RepID=UPI000B36BC05|nr:GntR family transcriptional regulator [Lachnoclostridium sp. An169]OUP86478.1 GntR family transcriptional regulator [Lachnoclostridium sp. An169]HJA64987.1 GntR family transcriptional regulator [Candidatus Mediterraneibacter cottocaccae]
MISIDYQSKLPLYEQIVQRFQTLILSGALPPGSQMPSVRSLAMELSINPNTIQKAFSTLEQEGYIYSVKGKGNFVAESTGLAEQKKRTLMEQFRRLVSYGRELGIIEQEYEEVIRCIYEKGDSHD